MNIYLRKACRIGIPKPFFCYTTVASFPVELINIGGMVWGVIWRKLASGVFSCSVVGRPVQRNRCSASAARCYMTAGNVKLFQGKAFERVQCFTYHIFRGGQVYPKLRRDVAFQAEFSFQIGSRSFSSDHGDLVEAVVPDMGESISDGTLAKFLKKPGDRVQVDEPIAQVETDKVTIDVASPEAGIIKEFVAKEGDTVEPGTKIALISKPGEGGEDAIHAAPSEESPPPPPLPREKEQVEKQIPKAEVTLRKQEDKLSNPPPPIPTASEPQLPPRDRERRVPMTRLRKRVAQRLKDAQNTYVMLTTFNEIDMTNLMKLRTDYKDAFAEKHGVKLGFMSGFVKAAVSGLQNLPIVNSVIDGDDIIYRDYIDISIAVGTPKGLVVPVIREADKKNFAEIEKEINTLAKKAIDGSLSIEEMTGGTFTISNGGVYGSLLSTPIINPPQSAILGMHSIVNRPVVVEGNIAPRPMMYAALTYDHRLIDGREAVFFLRRIKDVVEDPRRLLIDV
ncbi:hypothetical protein Vadar_030191 [Vaccinium darrowii]|uniref:Uncharacterized protein n=1 Tax=Vaccinium darrowii TaxID=229202 RepID=A0ACB7XVT0_9ERIC|nr:hypothetical protein Vadar_030191 [Vaccinium darrowii]